MNGRVTIRYYKPFSDYLKESSCRDFDDSATNYTHQHNYRQGDLFAQWSDYRTIKFPEVDFRQTVTTRGYPTPGC